MKKIERRAILCMLLAAFLLVGTGIFCYRFVRDGRTWAVAYRNQHIYKNGHIRVGKIYDRNDELLVDNGGGKKGSPKYIDDEQIRMAVVHAVGDAQGNVASGAVTVFKDKLIGYNLITGTYDPNGSGNEIKLTIDSDISKVALDALGSKNGLVGVYNYKTGEIICMVSTPTFDPMDPPDPGKAESGTFMNKFLDGRYAPGSIFKLVTTAAAIETLSKQEIEEFEYYCSGSRELNDNTIRCSYAHGTVDFDGALSNSCNCAFSELAERIGSKALKKKIEDCGLTTIYDIDGMTNVAGTFEVPDDAVSLAWTGIGQWKDMINPCSMLVYMGAIAGDGTSVRPRILYSNFGSPKSTDRMIEEETAQKLRQMMKNNVVSEYGESRFPGLDIYAKTGTAEVEGHEPTAWFAGFIDNPDAPYAFIVGIEEGGNGIDAAAPVANTVLQALVD